MADVRPFRALRYDESVAGPLADLVAPPYDVISDEQRRGYLARCPYNVVHLTLPDSDDEAARALKEWRERGVLVRDGEPSAWALSQRYVGPDDVERVRNGVVVALRIEPYERRVVLPHERTHAGPKEGRLRLLRATRTQLEPIFLLHDGPRVRLPERAADLEVRGDRLWRIDEVPAVDELLIADGHHRYETTLAFHEEDGTEASAWMMVVLVSTEEEGLTIFPTHRLVSNVPRELTGEAHEDVRDVGEALEILPTIPGPAYAIYNGHFRVYRPQSHAEESTVEYIHRYDLGDVAYTADAQDAVARVDRGEATAAVLVAPTPLQRVFDLARRGEVMPQKTTFFYPKLTSGLLFYPLD